MNCSIVGRAGCIGSFVGVLGGVGGRCPEACGVDSHRMTLEAFCAKWDIILLVTGMVMNCARAVLLDIVEVDMMISELADLCLWYKLMKTGVGGGIYMY